MPPTEIIFSIEESPEGGFQARALGFSIFTEADSLDELKTMIRDAVSCHFDPSEKPSVIPSTWFATRSFLLEASPRS